MCYCTFLMILGLLRKFLRHEKIINYLHAFNPVGRICKSGNGTQ